MGWNGAGNFQRTNGSFSGANVWDDDANAGYDIVDTRHDTHDQDLAQGINNCLTKDGQNSPTANLPMAGFRHTSVADGSARNQYATVGQLQDQGVQALSVGGTANAITASMTPTISSYVTGGRYYFKAIANNSGTTTLKIDSAAAVTIQFNGAALVGGEIVSGRYYSVIYDGTNFQILNPSNVSAPLWGGTTAGTSTAFTITPAPAITAYAAGQRFTFKAHVANGATPTLAVNGLATKTIKRQGTALVGNEFVANDLIEVEYDGTDFQLLNLANAPLFVDRTNNRVGIGTTAPTSALQVSGTIDNTPDAAGVHIGLVSNFACMELCESTGGIIDFTSAGVDNKGRILYTHSTDSMSFSTANVERMKVDSNGNLGIGLTPASSARLHVQSSTSGGTTYPIYCQNSSGTVLLSVLSDGGFSTGIGASSPYNLTTAIAANVYVGNTGLLYRSTSSLKYKQDVEDMSYGLNDVLGIRPVTFAMKNSTDTTRFAGLIAEEIDALGMPEFVQYAEDGAPDAINYGNMVALAFKAIQELNAKFEALVARVEALEP